jgi:hypothetical protein
MKHLLILALVFATIPLAAQKAPIRFRGAYIGQPLSDYADCTSGKAKKLSGEYRLHGDMCAGKRGAIYNAKVKSSLLSGPKLQGESFDVEDRKIVHIRIYVPNETEWEKTKYDLTEKLGPPVSEVPQVYQNAFGATWAYSRGFWVKDDIVVSAGIKVQTMLGSPMPGLFTNRPSTAGIEVNITDATRAKMPYTTPNSMD